MRIRRLCISLAGIGFLGALVEIRAATFNIADGDVACLISAINTANANGEDDVINLAAGGIYTLTAINTAASGATGLPNESAIVQTLPANGAQYTAIVRGVNGTTGIAVVEVYALQ